MVLKVQEFGYEISRSAVSSIDLAEGLSSALTQAAIKDARVVQRGLRERGIQVNNDLFA